MKCDIHRLCYSLMCGVYAKLQLLLPYRTSMFTETANFCRPTCRNVEHACASILVNRDQSITRNGMMSGQDGQSLLIAISPPDTPTPASDAKWIVLQEFGVIDKGQSSRLVALPCVSWTHASTVSCPFNLHPISTVTPTTLMFYLLLFYRTIFVLVPSLHLYFSVTLSHLISSFLWDFLELFLFPTPWCNKGCN